ncbi:hypothetical protein L2E82_22087 [Cichorium intybus]|uniref:Uncharacterized protein n=1 Tax=Cichorium intybus TaxID=13427 RepID=A0ACB9DWJ7_CICIN|nr:hypothetical protein L2E82_22087 [Cichorium intybus]
MPLPSPTTTTPLAPSFDLAIAACAANGMLSIQPGFLFSFSDLLLETLVKNCSEHIHRQMAERKILHEMIKIVKKKVSFFTFCYFPSVHIDVKIF